MTKGRIILQKLRENLLGHSPSRWPTRAFGFSRAVTGNNVTRIRHRALLGRWLRISNTPLAELYWSEPSNYLSDGHVGIS
jgi:hypothetical protein